MMEIRRIILCMEIQSLQGKVVCLIAKVSIVTTRDSLRFWSLRPTVCLLTSSGRPSSDCNHNPLDLQILTPAHLRDPRSGATATMPRVANKSHRRSGGGNSTPQKNAPIRYVRR